MLSLIKLSVRSYRPAVNSVHQEKILSIRADLAALGIATGRSRAKRNGMKAGTGGVGLIEAIERLREADGKVIEACNAKEGNTSTFGHNSLLLNIQVKLLKEQ